MKTLAMFLLAFALVAPDKSIYDFKMPALDGKTVDFSKYKGKTLLIVNTASKCGNTPQYADLQAMNDKYKDKVVILGFPANNFGSQEPGTNGDIAEFCQKNYGVTFQMFEKISVKGDDVAPLYAWLKEKTGKEPTWNFSKYIVKPDGTVKYFDSKVKPMDPAILAEL